MRLHLSLRGAVIAVALLFVGAGVAWATIPSGDGEINGCYQKTTGALRVIDTGQTCNSQSEIAISWNQAGPKGMTGSVGPKGSTGAKGQKGATGPTGAGGPSMRARAQIGAGDSRTGQRSVELGSEGG